MIGIAFLAAFLIVINIVMWIVLLAKFKKFFSTDDIISSVREEMDQMIKDMNRNTKRNITLVEDRVQQLKEVIAKADRHLAVVRSELEKQEGAQAFSQTLSQARPNLAQKNHSPLQTNARPTLQAERAVERYRQTAVLGAENESYAITNEGKKYVDVQQGDLFEQNQQEDVASLLKEPAAFTVEQSGASYTSVPLVAPKVTYVDDPIVPKKDFGTQARELYDRGDSVERIATELGRSITEVQFALDMGV